MNKELIKKIIEIDGVSGREENVVDFIKNYFSSKNIEYGRDSNGSLYYVFRSKNKNAKKILIDAHIDEIGFFVTKINENGLINIESQGGIKFENIVSQGITLINSENKKFNGVILNQKENKKIENVIVDLGFKDKKEIENENIKNGDRIIFNSETIFNKNRVIGKSIDNRIGTYILIKTIEYILENNFEYEIMVLFSTQEEVGLRGVRGATYKFNPELAIVVDVSPVLNFKSENEPTGKLGAGTILRHLDYYTIYSRKIINYLKNIIEKNKINYQNYISLGGTNAGIIQLIREGIPIIPIGLVARNIHSNYGIFDLDDLEQTIKLIKIILNDLNDKKINNLKGR